MKNEMIKYKCPRCHEKKTIDYGEIVECTKCKLEFYKRDIETLKRSNILAISELNDFIRILIES